MKYVKILSYNEKASDCVIAQCFDVPLNMLIPVSVAGELNTDTNTVKSENAYYVKINGNKCDVQSGQIIGLCVNKVEPNLSGSGRFSYLYDEAGKRRIFIGDLNAFSWGELVMKLAIAELIYSTDDEIMEVPAALKTVAEQKKEIETLSDRVETLQSDLSSAMCRIQEKDETIAKLESDLTAPSPEKKKRSWKRMFENIFGSEDSMSYDG